jgi:hypothetical protein
MARGNGTVVFEPGMLGVIPARSDRLERQVTKNQLQNSRTIGRLWRRLSLCRGLGRRWKVGVIASDQCVI